MIGKLRDVLPLTGGEWLVSFVTRSNPGLDRLKEVPLDIEVKKHGKARSRDANAFCWALCSDIGKAMTPPLDKEDVYRRAIKAVGVYTPVEVVAWDVEKIKRRWEDRGTGWFVEVVDDGRAGRKWVHMYYGTSSYTADEMKLVLDWLVDEARQMEIKIPLSKDQEQELLERWGKQ